MAYQPIPLEFQGVNNIRSDALVWDQRALMIHVETLKTLRLINQHLAEITGQELGPDSVKEML